MTRRIVDGCKFWGPHEGLRRGINLLKLTEIWVKDGVISVDGEREAARSELGNLKAQVSSIVPKVKAAVVEWNLVRVGKKKVPQPMQLNCQEMQSLVALENQLKNIRDMIAASNGAVKLGSLAIDYPTAEVRFSENTYFEFAERSIREISAAVESGILSGPRMGQIF